MTTTEAPKRQLWELQSMQAAPLSVKIALTKDRIREWVNQYGEDGVAVSFSGGKDSTVLLTIARDMYPNIKAVFSDTGLEYPEVRNFVKTFSNVDWIKPKLTFRQVIEKHGYPFISKEVSERMYYAQRYLTWWMSQHSLDRPTDRPTLYGFLEIVVAGKVHKKYRNAEIIPDELMQEFVDDAPNAPYKIRELYGVNKQKNGEASQFDFSSWAWAVKCPYTISNKCCAVMKKAPIDKYHSTTHRTAITGQMAQESRLRTQQWLRFGCNAFDAKKPMSNPMSFWTEQDVLLFIKSNGIKIASVYGDIVKKKEIPGQMDFDDFGLEMGFPLLTTTGAKRTGCMFCGFGCHLENPGEGRFERMKVTHPKQYEYIMKPWADGGLGYKQIIDWLNEHGNLDIRY